MPAREDVFGSLEEDELPSISDTIRYALYLQDNKSGTCVSLQSLGISNLDSFLLIPGKYVASTFSLRS